MPVLAPLLVSPLLAAPGAVTHVMVTRAGGVLSVAAISRAIGLSKTGLYSRSRRGRDPSERQSAEIARALAAQEYDAR